MREHLGGGEGVGGSLCLFLLGLERPALPCPAVTVYGTKSSVVHRAGAKSELLSSLRASDPRHT